METNQKITIEEAAAGFDRGVEALDGIRANQLAEGLRLESAKSSLYAREQTRLARKYGADHPRTLEMAAHSRENASHKMATLLEYNNAATPRPDPGKGWAIDGFVRSADGSALGGITVALYDAKDKWYARLGYACTNQDGYFVLQADTLAAKLSEIVSEKVPEKIPENLTGPVYAWASRGNRLLPSNVNQLELRAAANYRIEIIVAADGAYEPCVAPDGKTSAAQTPPEPVVPGKAASAGKSASATPAKADSGKSASTARALAGEVKKKPPKA